MSHNVPLHSSSDTQEMKKVEKDVSDDIGPKINSINRN